VEGEISGGSKTDQLRPQGRILHLLIDKAHNNSSATSGEFAEVTLDFLRQKVPKNRPDFCDSITDNFRVITPKDFRVMT
jgi:hypothetical protein